MAKVFGNVIPKDRLKTEMTEVFQELDKILVDHSGPFATNCVIGSRWRQVNDVDEFTKDGIKILTHLVVSEDPVSRFATRMTRFLGLAVDSRCHDGTTTSMLLFCRLAIIALEHMDTDFLKPERYLWTKQIDNALAYCLDMVDELKITEDDIYERCVEFGIPTTLEDVRAAIAYHMAMISSKGDHDLATKISYVIKSCPKKIFGMFKNAPLAIETDEKYILREQDYDVGVRGNIGDPRDYNYKNDTQFLTENAVIFACGNEIVMSSQESAFLQAFIGAGANPRLMAELGDWNCEPWSKLHGGKRNLIIMAPMVNDPKLQQEILLFNMANPTVRISTFNLQLNHRVRTTFNKAIHYMAGVPLFSEVMTDDASTCLIGLNRDNVRVHLLGSSVTISNLYEKDGQTYHPFYRDPTLYEPYTRFVQETEELILFAQDNISNQALDHDEVTTMISLLRSMTCQTVYDIDIGGSAHDQRANLTVYEDAFGAALSAVDDGVILGGYGHLARLMSRNGFNDDVPIAMKFREAFFSIVESSLRAPTPSHEVRTLLTSEPYAGNITKWSYVVADPRSYSETGDVLSYIRRAELGKYSLPAFLKMDGEDTFLLQAYSGYHEQLNRCRNMLPKLSNTTHLADMRSKDGDDVR